MAPKRGPYPLNGTMRINPLPFPVPFPPPHSSHMRQLHLYNFPSTPVSKPHPSSKAVYQIPREGSRVKSGYGHAWLPL